MIASRTGKLENGVRTCTKINTWCCCAFEETYIASLCAVVSEIEQEFLEVKYLQEVFYTRVPVFRQSSLIESVDSADLLEDGE